MSYILVERSLSLSNKFQRGIKGMNVVELRPRRTFSYQEICDVLPIILRITKQYSEKVATLVQKLERLPKNEKLSMDTEIEINGLIQLWQVKVEKLGGITKGLWIADFDSGNGYFCWKYPEEQILYWHGYRDGFSGRRPVEEYLTKPFQDAQDENRIGTDEQPHSQL